MALHVSNVLLVIQIFHFTWPLLLTRRYFFYVLPLDPNPCVYALDTMNTCLVCISGFMGNGCLLWLLRKYKRMLLALVISLYVNNWTNKSKEKSIVYCHMWEKWCILFQYSVRKSGKTIYYLYKCLFMFMEVKVIEMSLFSYLVYYVNYPNVSMLSIYIFWQFG